MKKILSLVALFAFFATFATAQTTTTAANGTKKVTTVKTTKIKKAKSTKAVKAVTAAPALETPPATPSAAKGKGAIAEFIATEIDYGTINKGGEPLRKFKFKNVGSEPLVIKDAKGSCGCTVPTYQKEPIAPGETSEIEVRYDTQRIGPFSKSVTLTTNEANETRILTIKGEVKDVAPTTPPAEVKQ